MQEREEWQNSRLSDELKAKGKAWLDRTDPIAAELTATDTAELKRRQQLTIAQIEKANKTAFERECLAEGLNPETQNISPSLRRLFDGRRYDGLLVSATGSTL